MLSIDYDILRLFAANDRWTPETAAVQLSQRLGYTRHRFKSLTRQRFLCRITMKKVTHYEITDMGRETLVEAHNNPVLHNPYPWIARTRAGIDTAGHELKLKGRAAIPAPTKPETSYEMDLDLFIDAKRAGLLDAIINE